MSDGPIVSASSTPSTPIHVAGLVLRASPSTTYDGAKPWFRESADAAVSESLALFSRLSRIEESLRRIEAHLAPKPKPKPKKEPSKAVLAALAALAKATGVPTVPADRAALVAAIKLHGEERMIQGLKEVDGARHRNAPPQFLNRNLINDAAQRAGQAAKKPSLVATWKPPEDE